MSARYVVHCHCCSHGEMPCDELRADQRCQFCDEVPGSYTDNGVEFCWLHRQPLSGTYSISKNCFFTSYAWRGSESLAQFWNAKLFEAGPTEESYETSSGFCSECQETYETWLAKYWSEAT